MCLLIEAETKGISRLDAGKVSAGTRVLEGLEMSAQRSPSHVSGSRFFLAPKGQECACK
jgi:hypothetical protein